MSGLYYTARDVAELLGVSVGHAYKLVQRLNEELAKKGYIVVSGKISKKYFAERYYGGVDENESEVK